MLRAYDFLMNNPGKKAENCWAAKATLSFIFFLLNFLYKL
jgi:hypothetical protein